MEVKGQEFGAFFIIALANVIAQKVVDLISPLLQSNGSNNNQEAPDLIYKQEAMAKYHFSASTAWHWQQQGRVKPYKIGRKVFYRESDIRRAMGINTEEA